VTESEIINGLIHREGEDAYTNKPPDPPTKYGVTLGTLAAYRGRLVTADDVKALTRDEATAIYSKLFIDQPGFVRVTNEPLRIQLIDFGVNSGPPRAIRWLQRAIGTPVTGVLDEPMLRLLSQLNPRLVNNSLVAARCRMIDDWTDHDQKQKWAEEGLESRALSFFIGD
jgi:lysozyme family protein